MEWSPRWHHHLAVVLLYGHVAQSVPPKVSNACTAVGSIRPHLVHLCHAAREHLQARTVTSTADHRFVLLAGLTARVRSNRHDVQQEARPFAAGELHTAPHDRACGARSTYCNSRPLKVCTYVNDYDSTVYAPEEIMVHMCVLKTWHQTLPKALRAVLHAPTFCSWCRRCGSCRTHSSLRSSGIGAISRTYVLQGRPKLDSQLFRISSAAAHPFLQDHSVRGSTTI